MEENKLPTKTKIAAWGLVVTGIIWLFSFFFQSIFEIISPLFFGSLAEPRPFNFAIWFLGVPLAMIILGILVLLRKKIAWKIAVNIFLPIMILYIFIFRMLACIPLPDNFQGCKNFSVTIPIIFLIFLVIFSIFRFDRKNFWKVTK